VSGRKKRLNEWGKGGPRLDGSIRLSREWRLDAEVKVTLIDRDRYGKRRAFDDAATPYSP